MLSKKIVITILLMFIISALTFGQTIRVGALEYGKTRRQDSESKIDYLITAINHVCEVQRQAGTPLDLLVSSELPTNVGHEDGIMTQEIPGIRSDRLSECAKENNIWLVSGLFERVMEKGQINRHNTTLFFNRHGELITKYLKTNVPPEESGRLNIKTGRIPMVVNTEFGKIGTLICWEIEKTSLADTLADNGAWLIAHPTWGYFEKEAISWAKKRSLYWVLACWDGASEVIGPDGSILDKVETKTTDPNETLVAAATIPLPADITPPIYHFIAGHVTSNGSPVVGTTMNLAGRHSILSTYTDDNGEYRFKVPDGEYTIKPGSICFHFDNDSLNVSVTDADVSGADFNGTQDLAQQYKLSGKVTQNGEGVPDVIIGVYGDQKKSVKTDSGGKYEITGIYSNTRVIVTPYKRGYVFEPESITINRVQADYSEQNFNSVLTDVMLNNSSARTPNFRLGQNYPNPFNPKTTIEFDLPSVSHNVMLEIYNILGQKVRTFAWQNRPPGSFSVIWDARDDELKKVSAGYYFYQLKTKNYKITKKMILLP